MRIPNPTVRCGAYQVRVTAAHGLTGGAAALAELGGSAWRTIDVYAGQVRRFARWCEDSHEVEPFATRTIAAYLEHLAWSGLQTPSLSQVIAALKRAASSVGRLDAIDWRSLSAVVRGARVRDAERGLGRSEARPVRLADLQRAAVALERAGGYALSGLPSASLDRAIAARDLAVLTLGFLGACRREELCRFDVEDVTASRKGVELRFRSPKQARSDVLSTALPAGRGVLCPVQAWSRWLELRPAALALAGEPAFLRSGNGGAARSQLLNDRLGVANVTVILRRALSLAGVAEVSAYTSHGLRAGLATELAEHGVNLPQIANAGRWASLDTVLRYSRRARRWDDNPLRALSY